MGDRINQTERVLRMLQTNQFVTNLDLNKYVCYRYGARIHELRQAGHHIEREYVKPGVFRYRLIKKPVQLELV